MGFVYADRPTASQLPGHLQLKDLPLSNFKSPSLINLGVDLLLLALSPRSTKSAPSGPHAAGVAFATSILATRGVRGSTGPLRASGPASRSLEKNTAAPTSSRGQAPGTRVQNPAGSSKWGRGETSTIPP